MMKNVSLVSIDTKTGEESIVAENLSYVSAVMMREQLRRSAMEIADTLGHEKPFTEYRLGGINQ